MVLEEAIKYINAVNVEHLNESGWDYRNRIDKDSAFKNSVCQKLTNMMGYTIKSIGANFRGHFKKMYNAEVSGKGGTRTLFWNGKAIYTAKVSCSTYSLIEYILIDVVIDLIITQSNYTPGNINSADIFTIGGHLRRVFGYSDNSTLTRAIESRIRRQFGGSVDIDYDEVPLRDNIHLVRLEIIVYNTMVKTIELEVPFRPRKYGCGFGHNEGYIKAYNEAWMYMLGQLPNWNGQSRQEETNEMKLLAISRVTSSSSNSASKLKEIRRIITRKYI